MRVWFPITLDSLSVLNIHLLSYSNNNNKTSSEKHSAKEKKFFLPNVWFSLVMIIIEWTKKNNNIWTSILKLKIMSCLFHSTFCIERKTCRKIFVYHFPFNSLYMIVTCGFFVFCILLELIPIPFSYWFIDNLFACLAWMEFRKDNNHSTNNK